MNKLKIQPKLEKLSSYAKLSATALIVSLAGLSNVNAELLDLSDIPLFLQGSAPPAVALSLDSIQSTKAFLFGIFF